MGFPGFLYDTHMEKEGAELNKEFRTTQQSAKQSRPPHPLIGFQVVPPSPDGRYQLLSWQTEEVMNHRDNIVQVGKVAIADPQGILLEVSTFHSGGHGAKRDFEALPGLTEDLLPKKISVNATYPIDWRKERYFALTDKFADKINSTYLSETGQFVFLRFFSDRDQTDRGVSADNPDASGAFAIHFDGKTYGKGKHVGDGTSGCLGFPNEDEGKKFFAAFDEIAQDEELRPIQLVVLDKAPAMFNDPSIQVDDELDIATTVN